MKILITESQYFSLLTEAKNIIDLRGQLDSNFVVNSSGNFYVIMSKMGNVLIVDEMKSFGSYEYEQSEMSDLDTVENILTKIGDEILNTVPDEFKNDKKTKINIHPTINKNIGSILYVNSKKKTLQNVTGYQTVKVGGTKNYEYKETKYFDPLMVKKTIKDLISRGYINDKFKYIDVNVEDETPNITDYKENDGQYFYHGTTKSNSEKILKIGLQPKDTEDIYGNKTYSRENKKSMFRGNSSTLIGYTDKNIYLTPSLDVAKQYAYRQSQHNNDEPVVLKVLIPDKSKLVLDDDSIVVVINNEINSFLKDNVIPVKYESNMAHQKTTWTGDDVLINFTTYVNLLWRTNFGSLIKNGQYDTYTNLLTHPYSYMDEKLAKEIKTKLPDQFFTELKNIVVSTYNKIKNQYFRKSAFSSDLSSIAYQGFIPPKFISQVPVKYKLKKQN
jgi:hypothetical protein